MRAPLLMHRAREKTCFPHKRRRQLQFRKARQQAVVCFLLPPIASTPHYAQILDHADR